MAKKASQKTYNLSSIPISHAKFGGLHAIFLKPDRNESGPSVLGTSILAMTVKFTKPRTQSIASASSGTFGSSSSAKASSIFSRPEKPAPRTRASTGSGEQADPVKVARNEVDPNHFVFAQLGLLYVYGGGYEYAKGWGIDVLKQGPWWRNDLVVVVRLGHKGNHGAVYVLYHPNSSIEVEDHSDGEELAPEAKDHVPGRLHPRCNEGFLLAKIADNLKELGKFNKEFRFIPITKTASKIHCAQLFENNEHGLTIRPAPAMVKQAA
ncbi:hypothetical protein NOF04DRAFT_3661 [Fusarium oxysporum II5]|uniref:Uncharacterized protein n=1 Tax=Fusarium odoratissimum (strain NRRL 54006) TaxID=1089451 RepID=X0JW16_FUSO5|nr:uncharacterized protein FOIG_07627 [Fusarium odoratissimum NRRL 54006]EXM00662.1 hypothetical protein FOIG_07627 [Fusarium odoratissimum NRRL 54006]KAK2127409.1 hypothetical protein NOF04DRAFT_3661 [Fusarium oxysporum II5]